MATLLAKNAAVLVTMDDGRRELSNAGLFARDGMIEQVGPTADLPHAADVVLDLSGQIVLPGCVNTQHHLHQPLTRNLPAAQNNNLFPWLMPPEGPRTLFLLSQSHPLRAHEWMTAREALEIATRGGAAVLGRDDIGSLEAGKCADFFSIDLDTVDYAGALHDPVAATVFCAPQKARYTVIDGRVVVDNGQVVTVNMRPVIDAHNRFARQFAGQS